MTAREHLRAARDGLRSFQNHMEAAADELGIPIPPFNRQAAEGPIRLAEVVLEAKEAGLAPAEILEALKAAVKEEKTG